MSTISFLFTSFYHPYNESFKTPFISSLCVMMPFSSNTKHNMILQLNTLSAYLNILKEILKHAYGRFLRQQRMHRIVELCNSKDVTPYLPILSALHHTFPEQGDSKVRDILKSTLQKEPKSAAVAKLLPVKFRVLAKTAAKTQKSVDPSKWKPLQDSDIQTFLQASPEEKCKLIFEELFAARNRRNRVRRYLDCINESVREANSYIIFFFALEKLPIGWKLSDLLDRIARCSNDENVFYYFISLSKNLPALTAEIADKTMHLTKQNVFKNEATFNFMQKLARQNKESSLDVRAALYSHVSYPGMILEGAMGHKNLTSTVLHAFEENQMFLVNALNMETVRSKLWFMFGIECPLKPDHPELHEGIRTRILTSIMTDIPVRTIKKLLDLPLNSQIPPYTFQLILSLFLLSRQPIHSAIPEETLFAFFDGVLKKDSLLTVFFSWCLNIHYHAMPDLRLLMQSTLKCNCVPQENTVKVLRETLQKFFVSRKKHVCKWFFEAVPRMWEYIHNCDSKVPDYISGISSTMDRAFRQLNRAYQTILLHHMKFPDSDHVNITEMVELWIKNGAICAERGSKLPDFDTAIDYSVQCSLKHDHNTNGKSCIPHSEILALAKQSDDMDDSPCFCYFHNKYCLVFSMFYVILFNKYNKKQRYSLLLMHRLPYLGLAHFVKNPKNSWARPFWEGIKSSKVLLPALNALTSRAIPSQVPVAFQTSEESATCVIDDSDPDQLLLTLTERRENLSDISPKQIEDLIRIGKTITNQTEDFRLQTYWCNIVHSLSFGFNTELLTFAISSCAQEPLDYNLKAFKVDPVSFLLSLPDRVYSDPFLCILLPAVEWISDVSIDYYQYHARRSSHFQNKSPDFNQRIKQLMLLQEEQILQIVMEKMRTPSAAEFPKFLASRLRRFPELLMQVVKSTFPLSFVPIWINNNFIQSWLVGEPLFQAWKESEIQQKLFFVYIAASFASIRQAPIWEKQMEKIVSGEDVIEELTQIPKEFESVLLSCQRISPQYADLIRSVLIQNDRRARGKKRKISRR